MDEWRELEETLVKETDVAYEQELKRDPYQIRVWFSYFQSKSEASNEMRYLLYERAVKAMPGSYKIWAAYLKVRAEPLKDLSIIDPEYEAVNAVYERALVFMNKMPRIWLDYAALLIKQKKITQTRRTFDRALRALPITLHSRVWQPYIEFIKESVPTETALVVFRRYLMLEPQHVEVYIAYLQSIGHYDEAARRLADCVNDDDFVSMQGKTNHQLWMDLCDLISKHPEKITSLRPEPIIRGGLRKFTDEVGRLWNALADHFIRLNQFEKARDVCEEAFEAVTTVRDFSLVFDAYAKFTESFVSALMEQGCEDGSEAALRVDLWLARMQDLAERRPLLLSSILLRQNPHDVNEWLNRTKLFGDDAEAIIKCFAEAVMTVDPGKAVGKLSMLWAEFAKFYEEHGDLENANEIFEKAVQVNYKSVDEIATVWCEWCEMMLRHEKQEKALEVSRRAIDPPRDVQKGSALARVGKSVKLQSLHCDLEESLGSLDLARAAYDSAIDMKVATPQMMINYAHLLEQQNYWEKAFKVYEKAVALFRWPQVKDLWLLYLSKFIERYGGRKLERARDLFEQSLEDCPTQFVKRLLMLYAKLEEEHGLARRALDIYKRACKVVAEEDRFEMYNIYISKTAEFFGLTRTREIYEEAINVLPEARVKDMCILFARKEKILGEIDRARGIYVHCSQFCNPAKETDFWNDWKKFEVQHGNEDTFREMLRVKRSVEAQFSQVHFNTADIVQENTEALIPEDPMALAESQVTADRKRKAEVESGKKPRLGASAVDKKEMLAEFQPSKTFAGARPGANHEEGRTPPYPRPRCHQRRRAQRQDLRVCHCRQGRVRQVPRPLVRSLQAHEARLGPAR
jgi:pre-mRNA-splicing factor SYF1